MRLWTRWLIIATGIACLHWLSLEDTSTVPVALLGAAVAFSAVMGWLSSRTDVADLSPAQDTALWLLAGGLTGVLAALATTLLMFVKTAWHSHIMPDYPPLMMLAMLERAPWWGLAGVLAGGALWLLLSSSARRKNEPTLPDTPQQSDYANLAER